MEDTNKLIQEIITKKWHFVHQRPRSVFYQYILTMGACLHFNKKIAFPYEIPMLGADYDLFLGQIEWDNLNLLVQKEIENNSNFLIDLMNDSYALNKNIEEFCIGLENLDHSKISKDELISYWDKYLIMIYEVGAYVIFPLFAEKYLENKLKEEINNKFTLEKRDEIFHTLTTPIKSGVVQDEERSLLNMSIKISKGENVDEDIATHLREFAWIKNNKFDGNFYTKEETLERVNSIVNDNPQQKLAEYDEKVSKSKLKFESAKEKFKDNKNILSIIDTLQEAIYFRSWRTERYYRNAYFLQSFFAETAKRLNLIETNDIFHLKANEILDGLKNGKLKVELSVIEDRSRGYLLYSSFDEVYILPRSNSKIVKKGINFEQSSDESQIKGTVAYPGKVTGPARIILSMKELDRVQVGDVLVTNSTTPDFVPVLKRVVGIVTEEGGVLSHASVISRELHIPCVIGTKIATKVLKDGDLVEVDANLGFVKIVKKTQAIKSKG